MKKKIGILALVMFLLIGVTTTVKAGSFTNLYVTKLVDGEDKEYKNPGFPEAWVDISLMSNSLPFAICILVAILTPSHAGDLLLLYCINGYAEASVFPLFVMGAVLMIAGILLFITGVYRNELEDDKKSR